MFAKWLFKNLIWAIVYVLLARSLGFEPTRQLITLIVGCWVAAIILDILIPLRRRPPTGKPAN